VQNLPLFHLCKSSRPSISTFIQHSDQSIDFSSLIVAAWGHNSNQKKSTSNQSISNIIMRIIIRNNF
jgi:hypothetical protein